MQQPWWYTDTALDGMTNLLTEASHGNHLAEVLLLTHHKSPSACQGALMMWGIVKCLQPEHACMSLPGT